MAFLRSIFRLPHTDGKKGAAAAGATSASASAANPGRPASASAPRLDGRRPHLRYFALPFGLAGRGGAVRFYFQASGVQYDEALVTFEEWSSGGKAATVASKDNVSGHLPVVTLGGRLLTEHHAIMRHVARLQGAYGLDADRDYLVGRIADASVEWRNTLLAALFGDDAKKAAYRGTERADFLARFEHFVGAEWAQQGFAVGSELSFADALVFALLWDDAAGFEQLDLAAAGCPRLAALYARFHALPAVKAWCDAKRP